MSTGRPRFDVVVFRNIMVPMRDGVRLATDVYRPAESGELASGSYPSILIRTSIGKSNSEWLHVTDYFPRRGYIVIIQDLRSRYDSEGDGSYYHTCNPWEGYDGYDSVEWIAVQPWSNGKVGMLGSSHRAIVQTQAALHNPPHLVTICPEQGPTNIYAHEAREGGAMALHMYSAIYVHALESQEIRHDQEAVKKLVDGMVNLKVWLQKMPFKPGHIPLSVAPCMEETLFNYYYRGTYDSWWAQECNDQTKHFSRHADIPVMITGGWYDPFAVASTDYFEVMNKQNKATTRLIMGPWGHGGARRSYSYLGDADFGTESVWGYPKHNEVGLRWFERWLKGIANGVEEDSPVKIFVMGGGSGLQNAQGRLEHGGKWRSEQEWPIVRTKINTLYLHSGGILAKNAPRSDSIPERFTYDPGNPVPTIGGNIEGFRGLMKMEDGTLPETPSFGQRISTYFPHLRPVVPGGPHHQKEIPGLIGVQPPYRLLSNRPDVLVFETPILIRDIEVTGTVTISLWVSSDAVDTDFTAKLLDIYPPNEYYPEGYHLLIADSIIRCRYRNSWEQEEFMTPGEVYNVTITLPPTSNLFTVGHRIRIDISSSNFPRFDINPNSGEPVGKHSLMEPANNTVYVDSTRPSHLLLPTIP